MSDNEISSLENIVNTTSKLIKDTYIKIQTASKNEDQQEVFSKIKDIIDGCNNIISISHSCDNAFIWEDAVEYIDEFDNEEFEKKTFTEMLFGYQLVRGKLEGIDKYLLELENGS